MELKKRKSCRKGLALEQVFMMMMVVTVFVVIIVTTSLASVEKTSIYKNYLEEKKFLDTVGDSFIEQMQTNGVADLSEFEDNGYKMKFRSYANALTVTRGDKVRLVVELKRESGKYVVLTYRYGLV